MIRIAKHAQQQTVYYVKKSENGYYDLEANEYHMIPGKQADNLQRSFMVLNETKTVDTLLSDNYLKSS